MATAPRRATKVPGATTPAETTTAQNAEDALDAILGTAETPNADAKDQTQTEADSTPAETGESSSNPDYAQLIANQQTILEGQIRIENKIDQLLKAGGVDTPKKMRWVQGKHGLEYKESK
ncbi:MULTISPECIES: hypothetical protein [Acinetobacter]|uniref:hypothetical protein n=1 Tax=Acinetobacter TaxID=469 RepID=UPI000EA33B51|nr:MULTISPECIES: hypothetical protein [Acinetobacter]RKG45149.1 hypothetical protein D7V51_05810 [Acinetobacter cumulans]RZG60113.1 hypothetical protein EXE29_06320 [Acinetobacter sp. WCHAc060006]